MELGKAIKYSILIEPTENKGFIVKVGCGTFAFSNKEDLKEAFNTFLDEPDAWEDRYNKLPGNRVTESNSPAMLDVSGATERVDTPTPVRNERGYL